MKPPRPTSRSNVSEKRAVVKKQPEMKGSVTLTQKQLDAILTTIGTLTEENAKLQVALGMLTNDSGIFENNSKEFV